MLTSLQSNQELEERGFCSISLLNDEELIKLRNLAGKFFEDKRDMAGLYNSHNRNTPNVNIALSKEIGDILKHAINRSFRGMRYFIGHFNLKPAQSDMFFNLHQDWNVVDETRFFSVQVWIPLDDSAPEHGGMFFLPGSHKFYHNYRSGSFGLPIIEARGLLSKFIQPVTFKAKEAACFFNRTFHGTFENRLPKDRVVVLLNLLSADAPTYYFHWNKPGQRTDLYHLTGERLLTHLPALEKGDVSGLTFAGSIALPEVTTAQITEADLAEKMSTQFEFIREKETTLQEAKQKSF